MLTNIRILRPGAEDEVQEFDLPKEPGYDRLKAIIEPILCGRLERVSVLADFNCGEDFEPLDMFVDDEGQIKGLPRNEEATTLYRRANQLGLTAAPKAQHPEFLHFIAGPAILFSRRVWF